MTAVLDAQTGIEYEGEPPPEPGHCEVQAIQAWNLLSDGAGGIDWSGMPLVCEYLGIDDLDGLIGRLQAIRQHDGKGRRAQKE